jgi:hypothetical protein
MSPLQSADTTFAELLQDLPVDLAAQAREFQAFTRARVLKTPEQLLRVVLLYSGLDQSLRTVSATSAQLGQALTDNAVRERLLACGPWLKALLQQMLPKPPAGGLRSRRLIIVDGSVIQAPGAKTSDYRLHLGWDWFAQSLAFLEITETKTGESLAHFTWHGGDVALADRNYAKAVGIAATVALGADVVVRLQPNNFRLQTLTGDPLDLAAALRGANAATTTVTLDAQFVHEGKTIPVWVHAYRLPEEAANRARQRCYRKAKKEMRGTPRADTLLWCGWVIILTTIPPETLGAEVIGEYYRLRWQIELLIKRYKSLLHADQLRAKRGGALALIYLSGKMLYACLLERRAGVTSRARELTWRLWQMTTEQIRPLITGVAHWGKTLNTRARTLLRERKRRRRYQTAPVKGTALFQITPENFNG